MNEITLEVIPTMKSGELSALPAGVLMSLSRKADAYLKEAKLIKGWMESALKLKYEEEVKALRQSKGRETGMVYFIDEGIKVSASLPRTVSWDQNKLKMLVQQLQESGEEIEDYLEVTYNIPERRYSAWSEKVRHFFNQARTFSQGKQTFTLQRVEEEIV